VLKVRVGGRPSIVQGDSIKTNISVLGINILLRVIELQKKKFQFGRFQGRMHYDLSPGNRVAEKEGFLFDY
jgi:hypothetical protein